MNYKLAKQLKDVGFPQKSYNAYRPNVLQKVGTYDYYSPTLEDLIEACGDKFLQLMKMPKGEQGEGWWAYEYKGDPVGIWGETPEEAVAKLWLALNMK